MGQSIESRPASERAKHYRELAEEAVRMAQVVSDANMRAGYLAMAAGWHSLAQEAEQLARAELERPPKPRAEPDQQDGDGDHHS